MKRHASFLSYYFVVCDACLQGLEKGNRHALNVKSRAVSELLLLRYRDNNRNNGAVIVALNSNAIVISVYKLYTLIDIF